MRQLLFRRLAPLASLAAQQKLIVHGTRSEYLLPSELLEGAASATAHALAVPIERSGLTFKEVEAVRQFDVVLKWEARDLDVDSYSNEVLVVSCKEWSEIREAAGTCLAALGFDRTVWEAEASGA